MEVLATLKLVSEGLTVAVTAISHLVEVVRTLKPAIWNLLPSRAKEERDRLKSLSQYLIYLGYETNVVTVSSIDAYLQEDQPSQADWRRVKKALHAALTKTQAILSDLRSEKSDFVLEDCYKTLRDSLFSRVIILDDLQSIEQPKSEAELTALREVNAKYKELIAQLREAVVVFDSYIKQMPKS